MSPLTPLSSLRASPHLSLLGGVLQGFPVEICLSENDWGGQTGNVENPWLSAISSHFGYWSSYDVALFLWRALHGLDVRQGTPKAVAAQMMNGGAAPEQ